MDNRASTDGVPIEKIIFERKDIREYSAWSFAQVRYNLKLLQEYEYLRLIKASNGMANQYRLASGYGELDFMRRILSPEELQAKLAAEETPKNPDKVATPG